MKHLLLRSFTVVAAAIIASSAAAQTVATPKIPAGYYSTLNGKKGAELKTAACLAVRNFKITGTYDAVYSDLRYTFMETDLYPESNRWYDMYSNSPHYAPSFAGLNREHSFPKSWWGGATDVNAYIDLNHLYPAESRANQAKSNYPMGEVNTSGSVYYNNGLSKVGYAVSGQGGGAQYVFEPADEFKGDFARTYFYMATVYQDYTWVKKYCYMLQTSGTYPTLNDWAVKLLLKWAKQDPVSQKEILRNEAVYKQQNNRNPFIDLPDLADYIWGDKKNIPYTVNTEQGGQTSTPTLYAPVNGSSIDMMQVAIGQSVTGKMFVSGKDLTGNLNLVIYNRQNPEHVAMFAPATKVIPASWANNQNGYYLDVTYTPTAIGKHEATVVVMDGGLSGSVTVTFRGECLEVPTLSACTATEASDIMAESYVANWTYPENEVVDYWILTRTKYVGGTSTTEEIVAEAPGCEVLGFEESDYESYSVQSVRLGYKSPMSNVVFVQHAGITGVEADEPLVVLGGEGYLRLKCSVPQTGCRIYDVAGRLVRTIDYVEDNTDVEMPLGVYFVVTDKCHQPVRVAIR